MQISGTNSIVGGGGRGGCNMANINRGGCGRGGGGSGGVGSTTGNSKNLDELLQFKKLISDGDADALAVFGQYQTSKDHAVFDAGVRRVVLSSTSTNTSTNTPISLAASAATHVSVNIIAGVAVVGVETVGGGNVFDKNKEKGERREEIYSGSDKAGSSAEVSRDSKPSSVNNRVGGGCVNGGGGITMVATSIAPAQGPSKKKKSSISATIALKGFMGIRTTGKADSTLLTLSPLTSPAIISSSTTNPPPSSSLSSPVHTSISASTMIKGTGVSISSTVVQAMQVGLTTSDIPNPNPNPNPSSSPLMTGPVSSYHHCSTNTSFLSGLPDAGFPLGAGATSINGSSINNNDDNNNNNNYYYYYNNNNNNNNNNINNNNHKSIFDNYNMGCYIGGNYLGQCGGNHYYSRNISKNQQYANNMFELSQPNYQQLYLEQQLEQHRRQQYHQQEFRHQQLQQQEQQHQQMVMIRNVRTPAMMQTPQHYYTDPNSYPNLAHTFIDNHYSCSMGGAGKDILGLNRSNGSNSFNSNRHKSSSSGGSLLRNGGHRLLSSSSSFPSNQTPRGYDIFGTLKSNSSSMLSYPSLSLSSLNNTSNTSDLFALTVTSRSTPSSSLSSPPSSSSSANANDLFFQNLTDNLVDMAIDSFGRGGEIQSRGHYSAASNVSISSLLFGSSSSLPLQGTGASSVNHGLLTSSSKTSDNGELFLFGEHNSTPPPPPLTSTLGNFSAVAGKGTGGLGSLPSSCITRVEGVGSDRGCVNNISYLTTSEVTLGVDKDKDKDAKKPAAKPKCRTNRSVIGILKITKKDNSTVEDLAAFSPQENMMCSWEIPYSYFEANPSVDLNIALFRYGSLANSMSITTKNINNPASKTRKDMTSSGVQIVAHGRIQFFAPKAAGRLVYRMFDNSNDGANANITLACSNSFVCVLAEADVANNLSFSLDNFNDKKMSPLRTIQQFASSILHLPLEYARKSISSNVSVVIYKCFAKVFEFIEKFRVMLDEKAKEVGNKDISKVTSEITGTSKAVVGGEGTAVIGEDDTTNKLGFKEVREGGQFHSEYAKFFKQLLQAGPSSRLDYRSLLPAGLLLEIQSFLERYCPVQHRFFSSSEEILLEHMKKYGFYPTAASVLSPVLTKNSVRGLDESIVMLYPTLLPSATFARERQVIKERVRMCLVRAGIISTRVELQFFGSTANNFGSEGADVDMCLSYPPGEEVEGTESKADIIKRIGEALISSSSFSSSSSTTIFSTNLELFSEVKAIPTARIPVVNFKDTSSGLDCDLTFYNPLALSNTHMLRSYSEIDNRVRVLAYVIKYWAKARQINSPSYGTPSSYAYILCLIYFLQNRPTPLLPVLQRIPSRWDGRLLENSSRPCAGDAAGCGVDCFGVGIDTRVEAIGRTLVVHPYDRSECNIYFYSSVARTGPNILRSFAERNIETVGTLLCEFFRFFATFDFENTVVRISGRPGSLLSKIDKAETCTWPLNENMSIEDPFETFYDVTHVVKGAQMAHIRMEFMRAYSLCCSMLASELSSSLLAALCEQAPLPSFALKKIEDEKGVAIAVVSTEEGEGSAVKTAIAINNCSTTATAAITSNKAAVKIDEFPYLALQKSLA